MHFPDEQKLKTPVTTGDLRDLAQAIADIRTRCFCSTDSAYAAMHHIEDILRKQATAIEDRAGKVIDD